MSVPTQAQLYDEVDRIFRDRDPGAPEKLDPDDPDHRHHIDVWLELRDDVVNQWTNDVFFGYFPGAGKLDPNDPADAELVEYWLDIRDRIRDDASPRYDFDAVASAFGPGERTEQAESPDVDQRNWIVHTQLVDRTAVRFSFNRAIDPLAAERHLFPAGTPDGADVYMENVATCLVSGLTEYARQFLNEVRSASSTQRSVMSPTGATTARRTRTMPTRRRSTNPSKDWG